MRSRRLIFPGALPALLALVLAAVGVAGGGGARAEDLLRAEIERWSAFLRNHPATSEIWGQVKQASEPVLASAEEALRDGRRLLALQRFAAARTSLSAAAYLGKRSAAERRDIAGFEAEWARMEGVLRADLKMPSPAALHGVRPVAVRALAEAALSQVRVYYEASLEYGRNTTPDSGLFYLGAAQAQREFAGFCRGLSSPSPRRPPPVRGLQAELDGLEAELLAAYRPPASIDKHGEFIAASSTVKEARELDAAGLRYGALLRYLQAAQRLAPLRPAPPRRDDGALTTRLSELEARLSAGDLDHSLGRLFLESAQADASGASTGTSPVTAAAVASDLLPRYFAALDPPRAVTPKPAPRVTITLVRWPYT
jgi:hypothetical protein